MIHLHNVQNHTLPAMNADFKEQVAAAIRLYGWENIRIRISPRRRSLTLERKERGWGQQRDHWYSAWVGYWDIQRTDSTTAFDRFVAAGQVNVYSGYADR